MRKIEIIKFIVALIIGAFLGFFLLERGLSSGDLSKIILFFVLCVIVGFMLGNVKKRGCKKSPLIEKSLRPHGLGDFLV